jgi:hypothetical protein
MGMLHTAQEIYLALREFTAREGAQLAAQEASLHRAIAEGAGGSAPVASNGVWTSEGWKDYLLFGLTGLGQGLLA